MILHDFQQAAREYVHALDRSAHEVARIGQLERPEDHAAALGASLDQEQCALDHLISLCVAVEAERKAMVKTAVDRLIKAITKHDAQ